MRMSIHCTSLVIGGAVLLAQTPVARAADKNLAGRFGIGYTNELGALATGTGSPVDVSSISLGYGLSSDMTLGGALGILVISGDEKEGVADTTGFTLGAKLNYNLVREENMIFYVGAGAGIAKIDQDYPDVPNAEKDNDVDSTSFSAVGSIGTVYFIPWYPNLGLTLEYNMGFTLADDFTAIGLPNSSGERDIIGTGIFGFTYWFGAGQAPLVDKPVGGGSSGGSSDEPKKSAPKKKGG